MLEGFLNWETSNGVHISYSAHYTMKDFDLIGTNNTKPIAGVGTGVEFGPNGFDIVYNGLKIDGFKVGVDLEQRFTADVGDGRVGHVLIDVAITDSRTNYLGLDPKLHKIMTSDDLTPDRLTFKFHRRQDDLAGRGAPPRWRQDRLDRIGRPAIPLGEQKISSTLIREMLKTDGYYQTADGKKVMLIEDFVADRATGELYKMSHVITIDATTAQLTKIGAINNGLITLGGSAPIVADDSARVEAGHDILLDVLRNDRDPKARS